MNRQILIPTAPALVLIAAAAGLLSHVRTHKSLAPPGVTTQPLDGSIRVQVDLPERVLDYKSEWLEVDEVTEDTLPKDTSFGHRHYKAPDGFALDLRVVLMGSDRTSMHKPQFCLTGQGWEINGSASAESYLRVARPKSYDLPVVELVANKRDGQNQSTRVSFYFYFPHI